jgi:hypothetical protein
MSGLGITGFRLTVVVLELPYLYIRMFPDAARSESKQAEWRHTSRDDAYTENIPFWTLYGICPPC